MNVIDTSLIDRFRFTRTVGNELMDRTKYTTEELISACERAVKKYPNEWIVHYMLGSLYQEMGYYAEGLIETQRCVDLRPNDIRSAYALATSYRILTRATWSEEENQSAKVFIALSGINLELDKRISQAGLDHTGLAVETCALQAIRWFERALILRPDPESRVHLLENLSDLYARFPQFKR